MVAVQEGEAASHVQCDFLAAVPPGEVVGGFRSQRLAQIASLRDAGVET